MTDTLNKRNITALHENSKLLHKLIDDLRDEVGGLKAQLVQVRGEVLQLRQQVLISSTTVGSGPTSGTHD